MAIGMNWAYLAGFFDGEGTIVAFGKSAFTPRIGLYQTGERGRKLLEIIVEFLAKEGIHSNQSFVNRGGVRKTCHLLLIMRWSEVRKFLSCVFPHLHIKRLEAQDALRYMKMYPKLGVAYYRKTTPAMMEVRRQKTCNICGTPFRDRTARRQTCSRKCYLDLVSLRRRNGKVV
jgi:hypothetical protein